MADKSAVEAKAIYGNFVKCFTKGICDSCGESLDSFDPESAPCFHWLLRPKGIKKKHIAEVFHGFGYFRTATYIRWVCNQDIHIARINDLSEEGDQGAVFHWSAEYMHIKWTFLCKKNDYEGHKGRNDSFPHYHVEMRLDDRIFIKFSEYHLRLSDEDLASIRGNADPTCPIKQSFGPHGSGMEDAFSLPPEDIIDSMDVTNDPSDAVYHIQTMILDKEGIPGEVINEALKKAKETGKPAGTFLKKLGYNVRFCIEPAPSVPEKQIRNHPRKKKNN